MRAVVTPEFRLAAACCRWPPSPSAVARVAAGPIDWARFGRVARVHRVEGFAWTALRGSDVPLPDGIADALRVRAAPIPAHNLAFAAESVRLARLFDTAAIPLLFVKGVTLAMLAYRSLSFKSSYDIDLLVAHADMARAADVLAQAGYGRLLPAPELDDAAARRWEAAYKETIWRHRTSGIVAELHSGLVDNARLLRGVGIASPRADVAIGGGLTLPTLRPHDLFAYLCAHGAGHGWSRLKWLADVGALVAGSATGAEPLYRGAQARGAGRAAGQALLLCHRLFDTPLPDGLADGLRSSRVLRRLETTALAAMTGGGGDVELDRRPRDTARIMLSHFALGEGPGYRWSEFRRKLVHPHDRAHVPLPRALHWLYPLLLIPNWLIRRARRVRQADGKLASGTKGAAASHPTTSSDPARTHT